MSLQDRMVKYRAKNRLSVEQAAVQCGISTQTWRYVERGLQDASRVTVAKIELAIGKEEEIETVNNTDQSV